MDNRPPPDPLGGNSPGQTDPAKARFMVMQACRWSGMALVVLGLLIINRRTGLPELLGYPITIVGLLDALIIPGLLAKHWKSPRP